MKVKLTTAVELLRSRLKRGLVQKLDKGDFAVNLLNYLRGGTRPGLLFTPDNLSNIARLCREHDPEEWAWEQEIADNAAEGRMYGATNHYCRRFVEVDRETFDFSSFDHPDPETIHGLNRQRWLASLARTYWLNCDTKYFDALMDHWDSYAKAVPAADGILFGKIHAMGRQAWIAPPYHELDNFIRLTNWWWAFWLALFAKKMTPERCAVLLARCLNLFDLVAARGIRVHKHNFTSMQLEALYLWASSLPEVTGMDVWRANVRNCAEGSLAQAVFTDGVQWEKSAGYHEGCIRWYGVPYRMGQVTGDSWAEEYGEMLRSMGEYLDAIVTPDGSMPLLSDSDRNSSWKASLSLLKCIFPDLSFRRPVHPSYFSLWVSDGIVWAPSETVAEKDSVSVFQVGGVAVVRTHGGASGSMLIMDNGPTDSGHSHKDNMTIHYEALGLPAIVDPGRAVYRQDADRIWATNAQSHNTVYIEDEPICPGDFINQQAFLWLPVNDSRIGTIATEIREGICFLWSSFSGFSSSADVLVRRALAFPLRKENTWLAVLDMIAGQREHNWTNAWLFPGGEPACESEGGYEITLDSNLHIMFASASTTPLTKRDDAMFWFPSYNEKSPARWVRFSSRCSTGLRAFVFSPFMNSRDMPQVVLDGTTARCYVDGCCIELSVGQ